MNVPATPIRARRAFTPLSRNCGAVNAVWGRYRYSPTSKWRRVVNAMQFRLSAVQMDGRWLGDILTIAAGGGAGALVARIARAGAFSAVVSFPFGPSPPARAP